MNEKGLIALATVLTSVIYIGSGYQGDLSVSIISFIPFIIGTALTLKHNNPIWIIITGEILVINNNSVISSLLIQVILVLIFILFYISEDFRSVLPLTAGSLIIIAFFSGLLLKMEIVPYAALCIIAIITGYVLLEIQWRRIKNRTMEDI